MEVGRREILTGLASVAVAGIAPVILARGIPYAARYTRDVVLNSHWHCDEPIFGHVIVRHLETGLTFVRRPSSDDRRAVALASGEIDQHALDAQTVQIIGHAARWVGLWFPLVLTCRPQHQGAVFFRYRPDADPVNPYYDPITEDAPPLPRFAI